MERWDAPVSEEMALDEIDAILQGSVEEFQRACQRHIPFGLSDEPDQHIKYIPERCIVTYFSWGLINKGFDVFNEQEVGCPAKAQKSQRFDLLARRFAPEGACVQIKAEAKGNLDGGYKEILADLNRMEAYSIKIPRNKMSNPEKNWDDSRFPYRFNLILTQNWGLMELSKWWKSKQLGAPKRPGGESERPSACWWELKKKLLEAERCGVIPILKSDPDYPRPYSIDILYAIFEDTSVEHKREVLRNVRKDSQNGGR